MKAEPRAEAVLCRYHYDALDRLAAATPLAEASVQRVYQKNRLSVEIQGAVHRRVMQFDDHVLAEQRAAETVLPATDLQRSVLNSVDARGQHDIAYSPYGHRPSGSDVFSLLGFTGERPDPVTGHYPLGNGYRSYNPVLMRFNQPDSLSPFGEGGVNAYAYCQGDPVNRSDPTGHMFGVNLPYFGNRRAALTPSPPIPTLNRPPSPIPSKGDGTLRPISPGGHSDGLPQADHSYEIWKTHFYDLSIADILATLKENRSGMSPYSSEKLANMGHVSKKLQMEAALHTFEFRKNIDEKAYWKFSKEREVLLLSSESPGFKASKSRILERRISDYREEAEKYENAIRSIRTQGGNDRVHH